jgi:hypothetical protein
MTATAAVRGAAGSAAWADALLSSFAQGGYVQAHPAILQPAEPFLDLSGEDIRKRMYLTADADGQHHPADILKVAERLEASPGTLVLGARQFDGHVPLRSRCGNILTRFALRWIGGARLTDSQTGLRGIPRALIAPLLEIPSSGYEFELDMLLLAKHGSIAIVEQPIRTIYSAGNPTSHFNPLLDSLKIYFVLLRFSLVSLVTAALDNTIFFLAFQAGAGVLRAQIAGRLLAHCSLTARSGRGVARRRLP